LSIQFDSVDVSPCSIAICDIHESLRDSMTQPNKRWTPRNLSWSPPYYLLQCVYH